jgi:hypothetical protein
LLAVVVVVPMQLQILQVAVLVVALYLLAHQQFYLQVLQ